jgi:CheY-like chemotaxis protein
MSKVLIIDDSEFYRKVWSEGLMVKGFKVETAETGKEGLEKMLAAPPQLIILDLVMPDMNGEEVLKEMRKHEDVRNIPVIMLTSISAEVVGKDLLTAGPLAGYMKKNSTTAEDIAKKAEEVLGTSEKSFDPKTGA